MPRGEKSLVAHIRRSAKQPNPYVTLGIGDDCAVLRMASGRETLITTDFSLEGVHFRRQWQTPEQIGHRCLARGLSDIAAMGGDPVAAFLSLALPENLPQAWVNRFMKGLLRLAREFKVRLAGGDTSTSPEGVLADIVVVGSVPKGKAVLRSGARPGDRIYVTGHVGGASAALALLFAGKKLRAQDFPRYFHPIPRVEIGRVLRENDWASAMIDLSDGLSTDLAHICEESGVGAEILAAAIPRAAMGRNGTEVSRHHALHGGDDYELLFTAPPGKPVPARIAGIPVAMIGHITRKKRVFLIEESRARSWLRPAGWQHFATSKRSARRVTS